MQVRARERPSGPGPFRVQLLKTHITVPALNHTRYTRAISIKVQRNYYIWHGNDNRVCVRRVIKVI